MWADTYPLHEVPGLGLQVLTLLQLLCTHAGPHQDLKQILPVSHLPTVNED